MPGYLPPQGYKDPYKDSELTYRASLLPIGTYADPNGGHDTLGFAWPGAVAEPVDALMRLLGSPSHPGTLWNGPDAGVVSDNPERSQFQNRDDMLNLLLSTFGGNATRGMGAVERGAVEAAAPSSHGSVISGAEKGSGKYYSLLRDEPDLTVPSQAPFAGNEGINRLAYDILDRNGDDAGRAELAIDPSKGQAYIDNITLGGNQHGTAGMRDLINSLRALHPEIRSVYGDRTSGARAGSANPRQSIDLFSDQLPSLWGSALQGQQNQPYPNSLFGY